MSTNGTAAGQSAPAAPLAPGDLIFVYNGPGLVTRLEGWALSLIEMMFGEGPEATIRRKVAVYRDADGNLDISARVSRFAAVESSWHLVNPAGDIVNGGPRGRDGEEPSQTAEELEAQRDSGTYKSHEGSVPVYGIPRASQHSPSVSTEWVPEARTEATFRATRGGMYRWYEPDAAPADQPAATTDTPVRTPDDGPYATALAAARKDGARHADDAGLMALFCANTLQHLVGAVSPQLVWEGAQRSGLSTADLRDLCAKDVMAVSDLQFTTD